jgi:hypothetical protein
MIDTDKYEGHTHTKEWGNVVYADGYLPIFLNDGVYATDLDRELMADAPLLLAEVKRLREELKQTRESLWWCYDNYRFDGHPMTDVDWNFIGNLLGADMESEEE